MLEALESHFQEGAHGHGLTPISQDYAATAAVMFDRQPMSHPHHREAPIKTTLSFQNLEAALPLGIPAGRRSSSRYASSISRNWRPLVQFRGQIDGPHGGIAIFGALFASWPRTYAKYSPRPMRLRLHPNLTIPPCGPAWLACRPKACLFPASSRRSGLKSGPLPGEMPRRGFALR